jgi:hypothetical protein
MLGAFPTRQSLDYLKQLLYSVSELSTTEHEAISFMTLFTLNRFPFNEIEPIFQNAPKDLSLLHQVYIRQILHRELTQSSSEIIPVNLPTQDPKCEDTERRISLPNILLILFLGLILTLVALTLLYLFGWLDLLLF